MKIKELRDLTGMGTGTEATATVFGGFAETNTGRVSTKDLYKLYDDRIKEKSVLVTDIIILLLEDFK